MTYIPCHERVFTLKLAPEFVRCYANYVHWLRHLLDRLGHEHALQVWHHAFQDRDDTWLIEILSTGWEPAAGEPVAVEGQIVSTLSELFPAPVETVSAEEARQLVEESTPIRQIRRRFPSLDMARQIGTYESLHLFRGGLSSLAEALVDRHGKQGELIAYDAMWYRLAASPSQTMPVPEFLALFTTERTEADRITAGTEYEIVRASAREVVMHITECEWARYYREHYPRVGYLMACSMDEASYRAVNPAIRMQRTATLMEGAELCDFRIYAIGETS